MTTFPNADDQMIHFLRRFLHHLLNVNRITFYQQYISAHQNKPCIMIHSLQSTWYFGRTIIVVEARYVFPSTFDRFSLFLLLLFWSPIRRRGRRHSSHSLVYLSFLHYGLHTNKRPSSTHHHITVTLRAAVTDRSSIMRPPSVEYIFFRT